MNIAVIFDSLSHGGGFSQSLRSAVQIADIAKRNNKFNFFFISTTKEGFEVLSKIGLNSFFFTYNKFLKFFLSVSLLNLFANKFKIKNFFVRYLDALDIDFVIFLGPSQLIIYCDGINFIMSPFDINFKMQNFFPEYLSDKIYRIRDKIIYKSCNQAFKLLVDSQRSKEELCNIYNCIEKKIEIHHFSPILVNQNINEKEIELLKNKKKIPDKFIFYPAQFWAHKNHKYIIEAINILYKKFKIKLNVIFCGSDKGNLNYIKSLVKKYELDEQFLFMDYISDLEVLNLYTKCLALVMPTYVARSSLPLFEAFSLKVPVLYSKGILDNEIEKYVTTFDLNNYDDLAIILKKLCNNELSIKSKINNGHKFYLKNCTNAILSKKYEKIIEEFYFLIKIWKDLD
jgi:glycosyltransferase involved in cell wall biosynthesis